jgi:hypothetical protein
MDNDNFVTVIQKANSFIKIIKLTQKLNDNKWSIDIQELSSIDGRTLHGFEKAGDFYFVLTSENDIFNITKVDKLLNVIDKFSLFKTYIDTSYNKIESVFFNGISADTTSGIYLYGHLSSFSKNYSCAMKMDLNLKPMFIKTYFENDTIIDILPIDKDQYISVSQNNAKLSLILDNATGKAYKKYDLTFNESFHSGQLHQASDKLFLTGNVHAGIAKAIEISLVQNSAYISDVKTFEVLDMIGYSSTKKSILMFGVNNNTNKSSFLTELNQRVYQWCNTYNDKSYHRSLTMAEANDVGLIYLYLVEDNNRFYLHMIRTDEEGATLDNPYDINCIQ